MDLNKIKDKLEEFKPKEKKSYEKIDYSALYWKPKEAGKTVIRIVPNKFDAEWPFKEVFLHYGIQKFPIYALTNWGEDDPIVKFTEQLRANNEGDNWKLANKLEPKMRVFAQVIVRGEEEKGVRLWEFGKNIYQELINLAGDDDYGDYTDINEGIDFTVTAAPGEVGGRSVLLSSITPKRKSSPLSKDAKQIKEWLENQNDPLELQSKFKKDFDSLKEILKNYLTPEGEEGKDEGPKSNYSEQSKDLTPKSEKFAALFDEEDED
jgi:hypothetical protein